MAMVFDLRGPGDQSHQVQMVNFYQQMEVNALDGSSKKSAPQLLLLGYNPELKIINLVFRAYRPIMPLITT